MKHCATYKLLISHRLLEDLALDKRMDGLLSNLRAHGYRQQLCLLAG